MSVEKLSISVPADVAAAVRSAAQAEGIAVSAWVASAAREKTAAAAQAAEAKAWAARVMASSRLLAHSTRVS
jgi:hypothetical protein